MVSPLVCAAERFVSALTGCSSRQDSRIVPAKSAAVTPVRVTRCIRRASGWALPCALLAAGLLTAASAHASTCTVTSLADSTDPGTLRTCLTTINSGDAIQFGITGAITLTSALPQITQNVTITGSGPAVLSISGANSYQVFNIASTATVTINGMTIANGNATNGGGISNAGTLTVDNCAFTSNTANTRGGAIYNTGTLTVDGVSFSGNGSNQYAGAIYGVTGTITVANSTFSGNRSSDGGAIFGVLTVTNSTFSGNSAAIHGGAIDSNGPLTVTNSTFSGNSAGSAGGAIINGIGLTTVNNSLFTGNYAPGDGGIFNSYTLNGSNNILGGDFGGECGGPGTGCFTNGANGNQVGVAVSSIGLLPLGNYGGPTQTLALQPGSAAICAGLRSAAVDATSNPLPFDQRGFAMDPSCAAGSVDIGAVQTNQYVVNSLIDTGDGSDNCNPFGTGTTCSLRDAIGDATSAGGDVTFLPSLTTPGTPGAIQLGKLPGGTGSTLNVSGGNILGPGANQLSINGDSDTNVGSVLTVTSGAQAFLYGLTITGGYTSNSPGGGGIYNQGTLTVMASAISSNVANEGLSGAGIFSDGTLTLIGSTVSGNEIIPGGSGSGGGIFSIGTLTLTESTVAGNFVPFQSTGGGGGIYNGAGSVTLTGSTISGNTVDQFCIPAPDAPCLGGTGGGIYNGGTLTAVNSIIAGNTSQGAVNNGDCSGTCPPNGSSNVIGGTPQLSPVQSNGLASTVPTMLPLPGSPAICAGLPSDIPNGVTTDERGYSNLNSTYPGYSPSVPCVDAGAVQTNYALSFSTEPPLTAPAGPAFSVAPVVQLNESGAVANVTGSSVSMSGSPVALSGTTAESFSSGLATFNALAVPTATSSEILTATLSLNSTINLTANSTAISVTGEGSSSPATLSSPTQGSTLTVPSTTFTWSAVTGATNYVLSLGTTGVASTNVYYSGQVTTTSATVTNLPANGSTIYARLYTNFNGIWVHEDYTFTEAAQAVLTTPAPSSTLDGPSITFTWTPATGATGYLLQLGSRGAGSYNLYYSGSTTATSAVANALPTTGGTIIARLFTNFNGTWVHTDYRYTESTQAALSAPAPSSTLTSPNATFTWSAATGATGYLLSLGTTGPGAADLYYSGSLTATSLNVNALPINGETIYARLFTNYNGTWMHTDYTFTATTGTLAVLTTPTPSSALTGSSATFQWTAASGATAYLLSLGTTGAGSTDLYYSGSLTTTSATVNHLPTNGGTIYVRLFTNYNGTWMHTDYIYTAAP